MEQRTRSIVKAISWRITGTLDTFIITFIITGKSSLAFSISLVEVLTKVLWYYIHERIWNRVKFGRKDYPIEYEI